jgi:hypothetical protein
MVGRLKDPHESLKHNASQTARGSKNINHNAPITRAPERDPDEQPSRKHHDQISLSKEAKHVMAWLQTAKNIQNTLVKRGDRHMIARQCLLLTEGIRYLLLPEIYDEQHPQNPSLSSLKNFLPLADNILDTLATESVKHRLLEPLNFSLHIISLSFAPIPLKSGLELHAFTFNLLEAFDSQDEKPENIILEHHTFFLTSASSMPLAPSPAKLTSLLQETFINADVQEDTENHVHLIPSHPATIVEYNQPSSPILIGGIALEEDMFSNPSVSLSL